MAKKITSLFFSFAIALAGLAQVPSEAAAAEACTPIVKVEKAKETSVQLKITCASLAKTKVSIKVLVTNKDDDSDSTKKASATLGKNGSAKLKISGLDSSTNYSFEVKVKKSSGTAYSLYSDSVSATTEGEDYDVEISKISSITDSSAKLKILCADLDEEAVDIQIAYKKKKDWSTKTVSVTLDDDGAVSVTVDGLKSETAYSFKARIKKDDDSGYSPYSDIETATTDEN
jgi:hypothetical protein